MYKLMRLFFQARVGDFLGICSLFPPPLSLSKNSLDIR